MGFLFFCIYDIIVENFEIFVENNKKSRKNK